MNELKDGIECVEKQEKANNINDINGNINTEENIVEKKNHISIWIAITLVILLLFFMIFVLKPNWIYIFSGKLEINNITIDNYNAQNNYARITINISDTLISEVTCYLSLDSNISADDDYTLIINNNCKFNVELNDYYVILKNQNNKIINITQITNYVGEVFHIQANPNKTYLAIGAEKNIDISKISIGKIESNLEWTSSNTDVATVSDGKITGIGNGTADITVTDSYGNSSVVNVVVTNLLDNFVLAESKPLLKGEVYSLEEANLLDEILAFRVNEAGYATRAGAVAAARFLTLEFQYSIPYFFENGRLNSSGTAYVDGEGRYYHKGLYLHKSKFATIEATYAGPAIWGMPLMNFESDGRRYIPYTKVPNGLDCSGFVSWALLNGGFDPGDYGAGESETPNQMTDLGEFVPITQELINSGKVKAGDLINYWGHIGIIIGIDDENYYVAETLNIFGKLVVKTYEKTKNLVPFSHIVLMDSYYEQSGNYSQMWNK